MKRISIVLLSLLIILSLIGCSSPASDTNGQESKEGPSGNEPSITGVASRKNIPIIPDAEFIGAREHEVSISEAYATDATVTDVIAFYGESPYLESKSTTTYTDSVGNFYYQTPLMDLLISGDSLQAEIKNSGPLSQIWIAPSDADLFRAVVGSKIADEIPDNKTVFVLVILTES